MKRIIVAALAACLAASSASAVSVLTQIVAFDTTGNATQVTGVTSNGGVLPFFFFDTNVGTLNSVELSSNYGFQSIITNATGDAATHSAAQFSADDAAVTQVLDAAVNTLVDPIDGTAFTAGGQTLSPIAFDLRGTLVTAPVGISSASASMPTITLTDAASLAAFSRIGTASYNILFSNLTRLDAATGVTADQLPIATANLTIVYNITPFATAAGDVPEPASWAMMVAGFGLVGHTLRRRRVPALAG